MVKEAGGCHKRIISIEQMREVQKEHKRYFYLENVVYQARKKLRELKQGRTITKYVNQFTKLMLNIPDMMEDDRKFYSVDGLQAGATMRTHALSTRQLQQ